MAVTRRIALLVLSLLVVPAWAQAPITYGHGDLEIETRQGRHHFTVELATTSDQQAQGLMFRRTLARDAGMLFLYDDDHEIQMWMKNTLIPLDMIFIKADGTILSIAERTVPQSLATIGSRGPARAVLEVTGGTAARLGIKPGDRVVHPAFRGT